MPNFRTLLDWLRPHVLPLFSLPRPEPMAAEFYSKYISRHDVVAEVGANRGGGTLLLSMLAKWVYSFEPNEKSYRYVATIAKMCRNVTTYNLACGADDLLEVELNLSSRGRNVVSSIPKIQGWDYSKTQKTKLVRLDNFEFAKLPTCLVVDCEGYELEVLEGARGLIPSLKSILIETHTLQNGESTMEECKHELQSNSRFEIDVRRDNQGLPWLLCKGRKD